MHVQTVTVADAEALTTAMEDILGGGGIANRCLVASWVAQVRDLGIALRVLAREVERINTIPDGWPSEEAYLTAIRVLP